MVQLVLGSIWRSQRGQTVRALNAGGAEQGGQCTARFREILPSAGVGKAVRVGTWGGRVTPLFYTTWGSGGVDGDYGEGSSPPGEILEVFITGAVGSQGIGGSRGPQAGAGPFGARHQPAVGSWRDQGPQALGAAG